MDDSRWRAFARGSTSGRGTPRGAGAWLGGAALLAGIGAATPARAQSPSSVPGVELPGFEDVQRWFAGHGGITAGGGTVGVVPAGHVAKGEHSQFFKSHLPGGGPDLVLGALFLRQFGVFAHYARVEHWKGTEGGKDTGSDQLGASVRWLLRPEQRSWFLELGLDRNRYWATVNGARGPSERSFSSIDPRVGFGYLVLTEGKKLLYSPYAGVSWGKFSEFTEKAGGGEREFAIPDSMQATHWVLSAGLVFEYHHEVPALVGPTPPPPSDDHDKDGIKNAKDACPRDPEDGVGPEPKDGCPSKDSDQDGVENDRDRCPDEREDGKDPEPKDGCPVDDSDGDGFVGAADECPTVKEDALPPDAKDGCPTDDPDGDGIRGAADKCPNEPETVNGVDDTDGCPDEGRVQVKEKEIVISDVIYFRVGSAEVDERSVSLLDEIAATMKGATQIELVEIQGHADARGNAAQNVRLTQQRAEAVLQALVSRGVAQARLTAVGYGSYCPVSEGKGPEDRDRRVEFRIVRASGKPTGVVTACERAVKKGIKGTAPETATPTEEP